MEKGSKLIVIALALLFLLSLMFAFQSNSARQQVLNRYKEMERVLGEKNSGLQSQLAKVDQERRALQDRLGSIQGEIGKITADRDEWKNKYEQVKKSQEDLLEQLKSKPAATAQQPPETGSGMKDAYWAGVVEEKARLEIHLQELDKVLKESMVKLEEAKKEKADTELELSSLKQSKEEMSRQLDYNQQMISSLSRELVREKSDKANIAEQIEKIRQENVTLRRQVKELSTAKLSLEKGLKNLEYEKDNLAERISTTEDILQTRMRELLEMKKDIESSLGTDLSGRPKDSESVELPPIVVKGGGSQSSGQPVQVNEKPVGKVLSVNEDQNFVIIDVGENNNIKMGDVFRVFRDNQHIATVEVIQTRKDISAADIKYSKGKISAGDSITSP
ncbi:MAG: hypothetical protein PHI86_03595 [Candidatus Omnitrophica bacterium]|nr:hypothetical protein [Candidatus Omnitrophota bacterium]HOX55015.1 hypothetical protein [Candidatus Omnitrophota bacterium]